MFAAVLDTCALWPNLQRDFLLSLAIEGVYRPVWSERILEELEYGKTEELIRKGTKPERAGEYMQWLKHEMASHFPDALAIGWEPLEGSFGLPDLADEHVVAAAVVSMAGVIVTNNHKHFPVVSLPPSVEIQSPAEFAENQVGLNVPAATRAVSAIAGRSGLRGPVMTEDDVLEALERRYQMSAAVNLIRSARGAA